MFTRKEEKYRAVKDVSNIFFKNEVGFFFSFLVQENRRKVINGKIINKMINLSRKSFHLNLCKIYVESVHHSLKLLLRLAYSNWSQFLSCMPYIYIMDSNALGIPKKKKTNYKKGFYKVLISNKFFKKREGRGDCWK